MYVLTNVRDEDDATDTRGISSLMVRILAPQHPSPLHDLPLTLYHHDCRAGKTPMTIAIEKADLAVVQLFLEHGMDPVCGSSTWV